MNGEDLINQLKRHEGYRRKPYRCTAGKLTIGIGRNLDDKGISPEEAELLLYRDIQDAREDLERNYPEVFKSISDVRQAVLINMCFNLGINRLSGFKKMWEALSEGDYRQASHEMLDSRWAVQVGERALELSDQMRTNIF